MTWGFLSPRGELSFDTSGEAWVAEINSGGFSLQTATEKKWEGGEKDVAGEEKRKGEACGGGTVRRGDSDGGSGDGGWRRFTIRRRRNK